MLFGSGFQTLASEMKSDSPDDEYERLSAAERKARQDKRLKEFEELETAFLIHRKALIARGEPVDKLLAELRAHRADWIKANDDVDKAEEVQRIAKAARDEDLDNLRNTIMSGRDEWETAIEKASKEGSAQEGVELWEGYQQWKRWARAQIGDSEWPELAKLAALLDD